MEGGSKTNISLSASFDTHQSDMLVPVSDPTMLHNRQKYQGKYLPSSLRYEHDGWAAGWDVYQFKFQSEKIPLADGHYIAKANYNTANGQYIIVVYDTTGKKILGQLYLNTINSLVSKTGSSVPLISQNGHNTIISDSFSGSDFTITNNGVTGEISVSPAGFTVEKVTSDSGLSTITVKHIASTLNVVITDLSIPSDMADENGELVASFASYTKDTGYEWYKGVNHVVIDNSMQAKIEISSHTITTPATLTGNKVSLDFTNDFELGITSSFKNTVWFPVIKRLVSPSQSSTELGSGVDSLAFNKWNVKKESSPSFLYSGNKIFYTGYVPVWTGVVISASVDDAMTTSSVNLYNGFLFNSIDSSVTPATSTPVNISINLTTNENDGVNVFNSVVKHFKGTLWEGLQKTELTSSSAEEYASGSVRVTYCTDHSAVYMPKVSSGSIEIYPAGFYINGDYDDPAPASSVGTQTFSIRWPLSKLIATRTDLKNYISVTYQSAASILNQVHILSISFSQGNSGKQKLNFTIPSGYWLTGSVAAEYSNGDNTLKGTDDSTALSFKVEIIGTKQSYTLNQAEFQSCSVAYCIKGYFQYELSMSDRLTTDNAETNIIFTASSDADLLHPNKVPFIDRTRDGTNWIAPGTVSKEISKSLFSLNFSFDFQEGSAFFYAPKDGQDTYIPGHIVMNDEAFVSETAYGLANMPQAKNMYVVVEGKPTSALLVDSVTPIWDAIPSGHKFLTAVSNEKVNNLNGKFTVNTPVESVDADTGEYTGEQTIDFSCGVITGQYKVNLLDGGVEYTGDSFVLAGVTASTELTSSDPVIQSTSEILTLGISAKLDFHWKATICNTTAAGITVESYKDGIFVIKSGDESITLNTLTSKATYQNSEFPIEVAAGLVKCFLSVTPSKSYSAYLFGSFLNGTATLGNATSGSTIEVLLDEQSLIFSLSDFENLKSKMDFLYTDTRDENLEDIEFASMETDSEFQFLKQHWDTTSKTENFYALNESNVLKLTKSKLIFQHKLDTLHDWNGNNWETFDTQSRFDFITADVLQYGATSAYSNSVTPAAYFWMLSYSKGKFNIRFYHKIKNEDSSIDISDFSVDFEYKKVNLGESLNPNESKNELRSYTEVQPYTLASIASCSSTVVKGSSKAYIIFGIHYDNNFNQWTLLIDTATKSIVRIIQGYGLVGLKGQLTGGEIPTVYFDKNKGFNSIVYDMNSISDPSQTDFHISDLSELFSIEEKIIGDDSQQWYITEKIESIVSHLTWNSSTSNFDVAELPLNNNVSTCYASPSFHTRGISDFLPVARNAAEIVPSTDGDGAELVKAIKAFFQIIGSPLLWSWALRYNNCIYFQQTIGQYAYVHYNSTSKPVKDTYKENDSKIKAGGNRGKDILNDENITTPISSDEISFGKQIVSQSTNGQDNPWGTLMGLIMQFFVSSLDFASEKLSVNSHNNQSSTTDEGRRFTQIFAQNMDVLSTTDMYCKGALPSVSSHVVGIKTLDMFYSTSDKQHIEAGPGFVVHNFVAQCCAQSVTSCHYELSQVSAYMMISAITIQQINTEIALEEMAYNMLIDEAKQLAEQSLTFGTNPGGTSTINWGYYASKALVIAAKAMEKHIALVKGTLELLPSLFKAMRADELIVSTTASASKHTYDMEGKHKYGNKSECFMWPCFSCSNPATINDEAVKAEVNNLSWALKVPQYSKGALAKTKVTLVDDTPDFATVKQSSDARIDWDDEVDYFVANCKGVTKQAKLPEDMAYVIGVDTFLPPEPFRNENIGEGDPVFPVPVIQDFVIDENWKLGATATGNTQFWISCKDTKLIDGEPSNIFASGSCAVIACPYTTIEIRRGIERKFIRPWAITPQAIALNNTGLNCCYNEKAYHAFDGYGYRLVSWVGASGMNKEFYTWQYSFLVNDRFKRGNKLACNQFLGNFRSDPIIAIFGDYNDKVYQLVTQPTEERGLQSGAYGEDKDADRYALPVFVEPVSTLPAVVRTLSSYALDVDQGVTGLTTSIRSVSPIKAPSSIDFYIGRQLYRFTEEYICRVDTDRDSGYDSDEAVVPTLGLTYLGATPYEAFLYSQATRQYYKFTGGSSLQVVSMAERFRDIVTGHYDFVNQEVIVPCLASFDRLDVHVQDDENEVDNIIVPRLNGDSFVGEICPPLETIFNTRSWFRTLSLPSGITFQGPNRCIINRFVYSDYMGKSIKDNLGKWKKVPREEYHPFREYKAAYEQVDKDIGDIVEVRGWTHNPFLLVTSALGTNEQTDNLFEWEITFAWPLEMDYLYGTDNYAVVNVMAETMTPGGKKTARPTHIFLQKRLFTTTGNYGYYSFRYQSKGGAGNRERLHIWSDQYIAISSIQCETKQITGKRTEQLTQQLDVQKLTEF